MLPCSSFCRVEGCGKNVDRIFCADATFARVTQAMQNFHKAHMRLTVVRLCTYLLLAGWMFGEPACAQTGEGLLAQTSWRLLKFEAKDGSGFKPADPDEYTIAFGSDSINVRFDCNRGQGTWKISESNLIELGPLQLTRETCAAGSYHNELAKRWSQIHSYSIRDEHLYLSLANEAGVLEFESTAMPPI
jgi:heat shock protein HslJ